MLHEGMTLLWMMEEDQIIDTRNRHDYTDKEWKIKLFRCNFIFISRSIVQTKHMPTASPVFAICHPHLLYYFLLLLLVSVLLPEPFFFIFHFSLVTFCAPKTKFVVHWEKCVQRNDLDDVCLCTLYTVRSARYFSLLAWKFKLNEVAKLPSATSSCSCSKRLVCCIWLLLLLKDDEVNDGKFCYLNFQASCQCSQIQSSLTKMAIAARKRSAYILMKWGHSLPMWMDIFFFWYAIVNKYLSKVSRPTYFSELKRDSYAHWKLSAIFYCTAISLPSENRRIEISRTQKLFTHHIQADLFLAHNSFTYKRARRRWNTIFVVFPPICFVCFKCFNIV